MAQDKTGVALTGAIAADTGLAREVQMLREGLWACYAIAGGDPHHANSDDISNEELVPLVLDCVRDLRGWFEAARRDLR